MGLTSLPVRIVVDTREQKPLDFHGFDTVRATLKTGDYSLEGFEERVAVERKSKEDFYGCVGANRRRFGECLERLRVIEYPCIVLESNLSDLAHPPSRTQITAAQAVGSLISWSCRYRIPVWPCENREIAERVIVRWFASFLKHCVERT